MLKVFFPAYNYFFTIVTNTGSVQPTQNIAKHTDSESSWALLQAHTTSADIQYPQLPEIPGLQPGLTMQRENSFLSWDNIPMTIGFQGTGHHSVFS